MQTSMVKKGFTLIELLIVIAIIGLLATLAIVSLTTAQKKARDAKRVADVKQLQNAVELYYSDNTVYPSAQALDTWEAFTGNVEQYITNVPVDPDNGNNVAASVYTYGTNDELNEYFIAAVLETDSNPALNGDDDVAYAAANAGWNELDTLESDGTNDATTTFDCGDGAANVYCVSE